MKTQGLILAIMFAVSLVAHAEPNKANAQAWLDDFKKARETSMNAVTLKDPAKRRELMPKLIALRNTAEKLFGPAMPYEFGTCSATANAAVSILENEIGLMTGGSQPEITVSSLASLAWEGAQQYASCRELIDRF